VPDNVYTWWGKNDRYVVDQNPRGYATVMDQMFADTVKSEDIILNTEVTNVAYDSKGVTVSTVGGTQYKAKIAITTFPLGVLNYHHRDLFTPNMPDKQAKIFDDGTFVMSNLTRIYIQFPEVFWNNDDSAWLATSDGEAGDLPEFQNQNHADRIPGSNTLLLFVGNPQSSKYEGMADEDVQAAVMKKLRQTHGANIPAPSAFHITRWGYDKFARGCYSALKPGFKDNEYSTITKPLKSGKHTRVYMAGEAMCDDLSGSTYGAYQSGREVALTYAHATGKISKKPKNICWA